MNLRPLLMGAVEIERLKSLRNFAEEHPLNYKHLLKISKGLERPVGDDRRYVRYIPYGYRIVYSIEAQEFGLTRHCSISVNEVGKFPNLFACNALIEILGFKGKFNDAGQFESGSPISKMWIEAGRSINILELIQ